MTVTHGHLQLLWKKAKRVGFTPESLRVMLVMLNLDHRIMTVKDVCNLWPYVNECNARRFRYGK